MPRVGFFGKLPAKGDFLTRAVAPDVLAVWEKWLETSMAGAKQQLGPRWGGTYERAPVWRFWIGGRLTGHAMTGVWAPSVDRVGRQFPLSFVYAGAPAAMPAPPLAGEGNGDWYAALDRAAMEARHPRFDGDLDGLLERLPLPNGPRQAVADDTRAAFFAYGEAGLDRLIEDVRNHDHQLIANARSYWWTAGNDFTGPAMVALNGMPDARGFAALLHGFGPPVRSRPAAPVPESAAWDAAPAAPVAAPTPEQPADMGWAATIPPTDMPEDLRARASGDAASPQDDASPFDADGNMAAPGEMSPQDDPWAAALASETPQAEAEAEPQQAEPPDAPLPDLLEEPTPETSPVSDPWKMDDTKDTRELAAAAAVPETAEEDAPPPQDAEPAQTDEGEGATAETAATHAEDDAPPAAADEDPDPQTQEPARDAAEQAQEEDASADPIELPEEEDSPFGVAQDTPKPEPRPLRGLFARRQRPE